MKYFGETRSGPQSASHDHFESRNPFGIASSQKADIVDGGEGTVLLAAGKRNFKLAGETLVERIP